jgi:hypothetical protein
VKIFRYLYIYFLFLNVDQFVGIHLLYVSPSASLRFGIRLMGTYVYIKFSFNDVHLAPTSMCRSSLMFMAFSFIILTG